jgi:hypothetical protein
MDFEAMDYFKENKMTKTRRRGPAMIDRVVRGDGVSLKWCSKGQHWVDDRNFTKATRNPDGLRSYCRGCINSVKKTFEEPGELSPTKVLEQPQDEGYQRLYAMLEVAEKIVGEEETKERG